MKKLIHMFNTAAFIGSRNSSSISLKSVRVSMLCYVLAYTFELMLFATRGHYIPVKASLFGIPGKTVIYVAHMLGSLIIMLLWSEKFKHLVRISIATMLIGFIPMILLPEGNLQLLFGVIAMAGLGGAVTSARCGYAFAANNSERLLGMVLMIFSVAFIHFSKWSDCDNVITQYILPFSLIAALSICLMKFRESDLKAKDEITQSDKKGLYWAFAYFIAYFAIDGFNWMLAGFDRPAKRVFTFAGMLIAGVLFIVLLGVLKLNSWHVWNLFFAFVIIASLLAVIRPHLPSSGPQNLFNGLALIGWPLSIYVLACAQKRFASYKLLKRCTLVFVIVSPITTVFNDVANDIFGDKVTVVALIYIFIIVITLLMLSPFSYKHLFSALWIHELKNEDMTAISEKVREVDRFEQYGLTPRQREVATLLLAAKTRRQISGELGLSESTVKTHTSDLYKKLNINSRVELFRIFAVSDKEELTADK